jgi:hypothetical protein
MMVRRNSKDENMSTLLHTKALPIAREIDGWPPVQDMPSHDSDFAPELHRARSVQSATQLFGETMSKKKGSTSDAQQKRQ